MPEGSREVPGAPGSSERLHSIDALRGISALAVCLFHLGYTFALHSVLFKDGWVGVRAFFVISGFVIP
jgi:peptidoglycan/LPS O-acetylase OafA/YrhL